MCPPPPLSQGTAKIEKEMLALVFATKKFHDFVYGRRVTLHPHAIPDMWSFPAADIFEWHAKMCLP